jgi:hypothetical protein
MKKEKMCRIHSAAAEVERIAGNLLADVTPQ